MTINKYYTGEKLVNYHQKMVRANYHYLLVTDKGQLYFMLTGGNCGMGLWGVIMRSHHEYLAGDNCGTGL